MANGINTINSIKNQLVDIIGKPVKIKVHKGRKRYEEFNGYVDKVYPNVFTVLAIEEGAMLQSFSYSDVLTKDIRFIKLINE